jgi:CHASE2 domain-containing sensor protein
LLGALAGAEHAGLLWWGAFWPWRHIAAYPGDGGMNDYLILASVLFVAVNLAAAAAHRRALRPLPLLAATAIALPLSITTLLFLLNGSFLDPAIDYLVLLPSVMTVFLPYALATRFGVRADS